MLVRGLRATTGEDFLLASLLIAAGDVLLKENMPTDTSALSPAETHKDFGFVLGESPAIRPLNTLMLELAPTGIPFFLAGESGTGKDAYARAIHHQAGGKLAQFKKVVCADLTPQQFLHELQGKQDDRDEGKSSTLFLDEIEMLAPECQRLLLTYLSSDGPATREGSLSARLISATTCDLEKEVEDRRFRRELFFRINGASLRLPPLRERLEDIVPLTKHFLSRHAEELKKRAPVLHQATKELLLTYHWPGNVRELENVTRKMVALGDPGVALNDLRVARMAHSTHATQRNASSLKIASRAASRQTERELILRALQRTKWNRKRAAQELQISYKSLLYKLKQIETPGEKNEE